MKKKYIFIAVLGLIIGYFAKFDFWFSDSREVFFPITKEQLRHKKKLSPQSSNSDNSAANQLPDVINTQSSAPLPIDSLSQSALFHALFNKSVLKEKNNEIFYFEKIKSRFSISYPEHTDSEHRTPYETEVANRLGLLKAMKHFWPTPKDVQIKQSNIKDFFFKLATNNNENLMVRREAYRNWLSFGDTPNPKEKMNLLANTDTKLLHLITLSDENLIEQLAQNGR